MAMLMVAAAVFGLISLAIGLRLDSGRDRR
jgi:hypothetical protein